jgi:hypothetical protein
MAFIGVPDGASSPSIQANPPQMAGGLLGAWADAVDQGKAASKARVIRMAASQRELNISKLHFAISARPTTELQEGMPSRSIALVERIYPYF